nr:uncharacterized protein LOC109164944 [Ipomoea batatas]
MLADGRNSQTPEGVSSWECVIVKGDKNMLNDLHKKFMHDILVSNINTHKHSVIQRALEYDHSLFGRARARPAALHINARVVARDVFQR